MVLSVIVAVLLKMLYFDLSERPHPSGAKASRRQATHGRHAVTVSALRAITWGLNNLPINACVVLVGGMLDVIVGGEEEVERKHLWALSLALGGFSLFNTPVAVPRNPWGATKALRCTGYGLVSHCR